MELDYLPPATNNVFLLVLYLASGNWRHHQNRPLLLDLFCGAGGAAWGYWLAGYNVVGVDIKPQPHYPFPFVQADALAFAREHGHLFDAIHASPPCQRYSRGTRQWRDAGYEYVDLVALTRDAIKSLGNVYVIENVIGSPLLNPARLSGLTFGLAIDRPRLFEANVFMLIPPHSPRIHDRYYSVFGKGGGHRDGTIAEWKPAMGIWWMTIREISQAIPPAFTEYIGNQLMAHVTRKEAA